MSKLARVRQLLFASNAATGPVGVGEIGVFGSFAAGAPATTTDPSPSTGGIQSLSNFLGGWFDAIDGGNYPAIEDMNAIDYLYSYQLSYILQQGVAEWETGTVYYTGSMVNVAGAIYVSLVDSNTGNSPATSPNSWKVFVSGGLNPQVNILTAAIAVATWLSEAAGTTTSASVFTAISWSPELSLFLAVNANGIGNTVMTSATGKSWTGLTGPANAITYTSICWSPQFGIFSVVYGGNKFTSGAGGTNQIFTTPDGSTYTQQTAPSGEWNHICFARARGTLIAVGAAAGTNQVMTSVNGTTYTARTAAAVNDWNGCDYSEELDIVVAVSATGTNRTMWSANGGTTWTLGTTVIASGSWQAVKWSKFLQMFIAVSFDGLVMSSRDGKTWTAGTPTAANQWIDLVSCEELGVVIAIAQNGTNQIMSTFDGTTWTARNTADVESWSAIAWAPQLGIAAAVCEVSASASGKVNISTYVKKLIS